MTASAAHGLICWMGAAAVAATAPVELTNSELAATNPTNPLNREQAMFFLLAQRVDPPARTAERENT
jgi:hypothetical protein